MRNNNIAIKIREKNYFKPLSMIISLYATTVTLHAGWFCHSSTPSPRLATLDGEEIRVQIPSKNSSAVFNRDGSVVNLTTYNPGISGIAGLYYVTKPEGSDVTVSMANKTLLSLQEQGKIEKKLSCTINNVIITGRREVSQQYHTPHWGDNIIDATASNIHFVIAPQNYLSEYDITNLSDNYTNLKVLNKKLVDLNLNLSATNIAQNNALSQMSSQHKNDLTAISDLNLKLNRYYNNIVPDLDSSRIMFTFSPPDPFSQEKVRWNDNLRKQHDDIKLECDKLEQSLQAIDYRLKIGATGERKDTNLQTLPTQNDTFLEGAIVATFAMAIGAFLSVLISRLLRHAHLIATVSTTPMLPLPPSPPSTPRSTPSRRPQTPNLSDLLPKKTTKVTIELTPTQSSPVIGLVPLNNDVPIKALMRLKKATTVAKHVSQTSRDSNKNPAIPLPLTLRQQFKMAKVAVFHCRKCPLNDSTRSALVKAFDNLELSLKSMANIDLIQKIQIERYIRNRSEELLLNKRYDLLERMLEKTDVLSKEDSSLAGQFARNVLRNARGDAGKHLRCRAHKILRTLNNLTPVVTVVPVRKSLRPNGASAKILNDHDALAA